jgi:hypothetical protein
VFVQVIFAPVHGGELLVHSLMSTQAPELIVYPALHPQV